MHRRRWVLLATISTVVILVVVLVLSIRVIPVATYYRVRLGSGGTIVRIVQVSDLHLRGFGYFEERVVELVAEAEPSLVVFTGDYVEDPSDAVYLDRFLELLRRRLGSVHIYAVLGNWDLQRGGEKVVRVLRKYGVELLVNSFDVVEVSGIRVVVVGFDDYLWGSPNLSIIAGLPGADLYLALVHEPVLAKSLTEKGFRGLIFAGHCHGGQVKILGIPLYLPRGCPRDLYEGLHKLGGSVVVISRGVGSSLLPSRIGVDPEVVIVDVEI